jgi:hypothetical protein
MVPGTIPESMPLLVKEPTHAGDREVVDRTSRKPEVPFMAGSFGGETQSAAHRSAVLLSCT